MWIAALWLIWLASAHAQAPRAMEMERHAAGRQSRARTCADLAAAHPAEALGNALVHAQAREITVTQA